MELALDSGVVIRLKAVSTAAISRLLEQLDKPSMPTFLLDDGTSEENPSDPDYNIAMDLYYTEVVTTISKAYATLGTDIVSIPDSMSGADSEDWIDELEYAGLSFIRNEGDARTKGDIDISTPYKRKQEWKRLIALNGASSRDIVAGVIRLSGTMEQEVLRAYSWFQTRTKRGGSILNSATESSEDGDTSQTADAGNGVAVRGNARVPVGAGSVEPVVRTGTQF